MAPLTRAPWSLQGSAGWEAEESQQLHLGAQDRKDWASHGSISLAPPTVAARLPEVASL